MIGTLRDPILSRRRRARDRRAAEAAAAHLEQRFAQIDGDCRALRAEGWDPSEYQRLAEIANRAARAERRCLEELS